MINADKPRRCLSKKLVGPCKAIIPSWWFDNGECKVFGYGGCKGNENRFPTKEECEKICKRCLSKKLVGPCKAIIPSWWYDNGECKVFGYGGCKGNENRFSTKEECEKICKFMRLKSFHDLSEGLSVPKWDAYTNVERLTLIGRVVQNMQMHVLFADMPEESRIGGVMVGDLARILINIENSYHIQELQL
uniref:BPTI/Kunitz inhibitor domain-containing protein n=1 Tax=Meloidogyne floridensis TaxID=298350 RepID=A0A915P9D2_9BILA